MTNNSNPTDSSHTFSESSDEFSHFALRLAVSHAQRARLDPDVAASIAGEIAVEITNRTSEALERRKLFITIVYRQLIPRVLDELQLFGPKCNAIRMRKRRQAKQALQDKNNQNQWGRVSFDEEVHRKPVQKSPYNHLEFMDQFSHDPDLQEYVVLVAAGYTQTEMIREFGYTRAKISQMKARFEDVYEK